MIHRRAIVHIGMPKTGSTSIQRKLHSSLDDPEFQYISLEATKDSNHIFSLFTQAPEKYHVHQKLAHNPAQIEAFNLNIEQLLIAQFNNGQTPNVIISAETITSLKEAELQKLKQFLQRFFNEIAIVGYIRPPRSFMESSFQQTVKGPNMAANIAQVYPNYRWKFERFDHVFGREQVHLWKFEPKNFLQGDVVLDFCKRLGITMPSGETPSRDNESLSKQALQLLFTYRKFYPYGTGSAAVKENNRLIQAIKPIGDKKLRFSPAMLRAIFADHRDDIAWIEQRLGTSVAEILEPDADDINSDTELLNVDLATIGQLKDLLGNALLLEPIDGDTPEQVARLMHCLRLKLSEKTHQPQDNINLKKLVQLAKQAAPGQLGAIPDNKAVALLREVFKQLNRQIETSSQESVKIAELGQFKIRRIEQEGKKVAVKRIIFNPVKPNT